MQPTVGEYLRSVIIAAWFIIALTLCMIILVPALIISFGRLRNHMIKYLGYFLGRTVLWVAGINFKIEYIGPKPKDPAVFIMNHSSTLDLFILLALQLPNIRFVAKKEFLYNPLFFVTGKLTDHIFIDRKDSKKSIQTLNKAIEKIKSQNLSVFFAPEGTRKHKGVIGIFHSGAFYMAHDLNYPVVPIYVEGARELCPGNSLLTRKGAITAYIYPPVHINDRERAKMPAVAKEMRSRYMEWAGIKNEEENMQVEA